MVSLNHESLLRLQDHTILTAKFQDFCVGECLTAKKNIESNMHSLALQK